MSIVSHLHQLFNAETCQSYIHTLRWKDRPLQCPRCQSHNVGPWGTLPKPCHNILSVSGYFRRLNADTRRTMCLSFRQELQRLYTGCDKYWFSTPNTLFFLFLCLNDNFLPIPETLCEPSEVK
jgi:hypothetical protein